MTLYINVTCDKYIARHLTKWLLSTRFTESNENFNLNHQTINVFLTCYMTHDMSHVTKCDKIINKLISQLKLNRIQQNFKLKLPNNESVKT